MVTVSIGISQSGRSVTSADAQKAIGGLLSEGKTVSGSLRDKVTEVSGRGVGLDAVQHMVRQLRGAVVLEQKAGEGSRYPARCRNSPPCRW